MIDHKGRKIDYMRISLTDRCNLRCKYCMPDEGVSLLRHEDILSYEEIIKIVRVAANLGISKIRLTGGEPLLRKNITYLVKSIKNIKGIEEVSITTNGILLERLLDDLIEAGLDRINLSLDTMNCATYKEITGSDKLQKVLNGLYKALDSGLKVKINVVPLRGYNTDELIDLVKLTIDRQLDVRFIELMPIGLGKNFDSIENEDILKEIKKEYKIHKMLGTIGNGPAVYYKIQEGKGSIGFISPLSHQFCKECNRIRLTAEGFLKLCLHSNKGISLRDLLRKNISENELEEIMRTIIALKPDRHHFQEDTENEDSRRMHQIGG
jgi:cyclic pyranopterin phosphate synthase